MTLQEFKDSLKENNPPAGCSRAIHALWEAGRGNWDASHEVTQEPGDPDVDWVHAYLHREEGDLSNAGYWYRRAGRTMSKKSLAEEWDDIATELLAK
ncbi:hypothetical protein KFU94_27245 [Chloroflexi bacterium TSY]|nr:hypothetical protein [Chloroflexi bacterium TSY]